MVKDSYDSAVAIYMTQEKIRFDPPFLAHYQQAHLDTLHEIIGELPLFPGDRVLDATCTDGFYSLALAKRVVPGGSVVGLEHDSDELAQVRAMANNSGLGKAIALKHGEVNALPFDANSFDFVWAVQQRIEPFQFEDVLQQIQRVVRPRGYVAMLYQNLFATTQITWPAELKQPIHQAMIEAGLVPQDPGEYDLELAQAFTHAGLIVTSNTPYVSVRRLPLNNDERNYLSSYLSQLSHYLQPWLAPEYFAQLSQLCEPDSADSLLNRVDFQLTYRDQVILAHK
jgi:SAM-dependent methyltransferase